ncbi:hypothetical protein EGW08_017784 [Elysia chlorotica]|uniref:EGF-like domain-containing protein n=1 Tax=Elysia chlorotica TaxID=188477 RepID=A0A433SYS5_ELYCH|nr:hypothetical protein EGW08_017784 [Elysia chlorotica]
MAVDSDQIVSMVKEKLVTAISSLSSDDLIVEIAKLSQLEQRYRGAVERPAEISATVVVRSTKSLQDSELNAALSLGDCETNCPLGSIYVFTPPQVQQDTDLCSLAAVNLCDVMTTSCVEVENRILCECLPGFEKAQDPNFCQDKNECRLGTNNCGTKNCTNTFGSYSCACSSGQFWHQSNMECTAEACQSNPCKDDWKCDLIDSGAGYVCSPKSDSLDDDDDDEEKWRLALIIVASVLGFLCLCLTIALICLCVRRRKTLEMDSYSNSRYNDLAHKRSSGTEMLEQRGRGNLHGGQGHNGAYDNRTYTNDRP